MTVTIVFFAALAGIILLFSVKRMEYARSARLGENFRMSADRGALRIKVWIEKSEEILENIPWFLLALTRYGIHIGALSFARLARVAAIRAHQLADFVSHKHRFERRETKSSFLKEVGEYKNGKDHGSA